MGKRVYRTLALGLFCLPFATAHAQTVTPVPKLDVNRLTGTWYEAARYPNKQQKSCLGDVMVIIALGNKPNSLQFVNTCRTKADVPDVRNGNAIMIDKNGDGKLKITYTWPFSTKYWVLALGEQYEWALVGTPDHKKLWILGRTIAFNPNLLVEIKQKAAAQGFLPDKIVSTPQSVR